MTADDSADPPHDVVRVAAVQMRSVDDVAANIARAGDLVAEAARSGARLVVLPEKWNLVADRAATVAAGEPLDGPSLAAVAGWARTWGITVVAGTIAEAFDAVRVRNTCAVVGPGGTVDACYRKMHLFDVEAGGRTYRESDEAQAGDEVVVAPAEGLRLGLSVCYDLRFPELYRALVDAGADTLLVPAAFTAATGPPHWEVLLRARAIENQCAVIASGQVGRHPNGMESHGHSMIVDAWGAVLAAAAPDDGQCVVVADIDRAAQRDVRRRLPALEHRRLRVEGRPV